MLFLPYKNHAEFTICYLSSPFPGEKPRRLLVTPKLEVFLFCLFPVISFPMHGVFQLFSSLSQGPLSILCFENSTEENLNISSTEREGKEQKPLMFCHCRAKEAAQPLFPVDISEYKN